MKLTAKCIAGHTWVMTEEQKEEAKNFGVAMCPTCGNVATVEKVKYIPKHPVANNLKKSKKK